MKNEFAIFMSNQMIEKELTLREVSRRSGIGTNDLSRIERGMTYPPKGEVIRNLVVALEVDDEQIDKVINLAGTVNNRLDHGPKYYTKGFNTTPTLIHYTGNHSNTSNVDRQGFMEMVMDENTFRDKEQL